MAETSKAGSVALFKVVTTVSTVTVDKVVTRKEEFVVLRPRTSERQRPTLKNRTNGPIIDSDRKKKGLAREITDPLTLVGWARSALTPTSHG